MDRGFALQRVSTVGADNARWVCVALARGERALFWLLPYQRQSREDLHRMYRLRLLAGSFLDRKTLKGLFHLEATFLYVFGFLDFSVFGHSTW